MNKDQYLQPHTNYKNFDFSQTALIKPPFEEFKNNQAGNKFTRIIVDSRDRNQSLYPSPSLYEIQLDEEIEDVTAAEVMVMDIPFTSYLININNSKLHVASDSIDYLVTIPEGDYTGASLASALSKSLVSQTFSLFEISYDTVKDNFSISSNRSFKLRFEAMPTSNLYKVLGFSRSDQDSIIRPANSSGHTHFLGSQFRKDFNDHKYIVLHIDQISLNISNNTNTNKSIALIPNRFSTLNHFTTTPIKKFFNPPIGRLTKLRFTFKDYYGNIYDFQNADHRIDIMFESSKHLRRYQN